MLGFGVFSGLWVDVVSYVIDVVVVLGVGLVMLLDIDVVLIMFVDVFIVIFDEVVGWLEGVLFLVFILSV